MPDKCYYFGCWGCAGHYLFAPDGTHGPHQLERYRYRTVHLDGTLAPRRNQDGELCWEGQGATPGERDRIHCRTSEYPQGQFLLHHLDTGYTAIQWWDRCQGDKRGACNSTILLAGEHTAEEMLEALKEHFPRVLERLTKNGVALSEVHKG